MKSATLVLLSTLILTSLPASAQEPQEAPEAAPKVPAAGSAEAARLLSMAVDKMLAIGRGHFVSNVVEENSIIRQTGGMVGARQGKVEGAWSDDVVFATVNDMGDEVVLHNGRMLARDGDDWKLRASTLPSGAETPFVLQPKLFFTLLRDLPTEARKVRHVQATSYKGRDLVILGLTFEEQTAIDFDLSGAIPTASGMAGMRVLDPGGGMRTPPADTTIDVALYVDPDGGNVHRVRIKSYKETPMPVGFQIAVAGPEGVAAEAEEDDDQESEGDGSRYKGGLPVREVGDQESMVYYRISFSSHGLAQMPKLAPEDEELLDIR